MPYQLQIYIIGINLDLFFSFSGSGEHRWRLLHICGPSLLAHHHELPWNFSFWETMAMRAQATVADLFVSSSRIEYFGLICNLNAFSIHKRHVSYTQLKEQRSTWHFHPFYLHRTVQWSEGITNKFPKTFLLQKYLYAVFIACREQTNLESSQTEALVNKVWRFLKFFNFPLRVRF